MKRKLLFLLLFVLPFSLCFAQKSWIRINQLGYLNKSVKAAVLVSKEDLNPKYFEICDALTGLAVWKSKNISSYGPYGAFLSSFRLNFSDFSKSGAYFLKAGQVKSPSFRIANDVYDGTADFLLKYMRQQQCGYNPFIKDSCHTHDGFIIYHPDPKVDSTHIDVVGGWHDASDYLQYVTTSANAVFQLLFAYQQNPASFGDEFDKNGNPGANGIPDILDQAKWGMDWLVKMNPSKNVMFNQIADDRDHAGFKMPSLDPVSYGKGKERPVYFCTGKAQGVFNNKNRTTGIASTAGKYASAFSMGAEIFSRYYPEFAKMLKTKAVEAYDYGVENPGVCQTAPCKSPYFYEEDNWVDDMELAATQLYEYSGKNYLKDAVQYGQQEPVTPWMGADTARHYQWYPFLNLGHYFLAKNSNRKIAKEFRADFKKGIDNVYRKGKNNPFLIGIPFIWCSNNLLSAMLTQSHLYFNLTKDHSYQEMEAALRDWLFGCNPWGTSMIIGLPKDGDNPSDPHSAFSAVYHMQIDGGLVDGPVYATIFNMLKGLTLHRPDQYAELQSKRVVYHDDYGDYSTNEPTMDGTASLTYYLGALQAEGNKNEAMLNSNNQMKLGAIIRTDKSKKEIHLAFTAHDKAEGGEIVRNVLKKHHIKASFFFTGDFYRNSKFTGLINALKKDGNYLGAHSNKHLLYAPWENRDSLLVSRQDFINDLSANYAEMKKFGINKEDAGFFLPPFEWYNQTISDWTKELGLKLVNYSPGTRSNADYTSPETGNNYVSSDLIFKSILNFEASDKDGLNGFILLTHLAAAEGRKDLFYNRLDGLITELEARGYKFTLLK